MDDQNTDEIVQQAEEKSNDDVKVLMSLDELIKNNIASTDKLKEELKKYRQMLSDAFENDSTYREQDEKVKEVSKVRNATKQQIFKQPSIVNTFNKAKSISAEIKEKEASLSDYLQEYQRMAGVNEIEGLDGEVREIVNISKVVKRSSRK